MPVNWKAILSLFVIFTIIGLLIFSPKGQKLMGNSTAPVGSFFKTFTGRISKSGVDSGSKRLDIEITEIEPSSLGDLKISITGDDFEGKINYEVLSFLDSNIEFDEKRVKIRVRDLVGDIDYFRNGKMKISGKTSSLKLNEMEINNPEINFLITGDPINYDVEDIKKEELDFSSLSGSLRCSQLTGGNLRLSNDQLEFFNFEGSLSHQNNTVRISGQTDKMIINGVEISKT